ncbi:hypothetical protein SAMN05444007_101284 [Cribrihabitans marinus]|uniref:Uncharacterized protein n=1 Tax=Cribrihabitans marinus TaxID=1227549 RepID=A0A1H6QST9_9RHOB|nr:hypothetical protein [Cribrihabitans marinus]GGH19791.1 hypothetical protein GCM10010973_03300 [Cribrihabitans marinus]SEI46751.1 hypothetical protein SAMN05444007_101284 [Cribrihabitans marinus]
MSNVIHLPKPARARPGAESLAALIDCFARHRRVTEDVFWLKENAELLNILECTGTVVPQDALAPLRDFYQTLEQRLGFFPQYYRFLLSVCLDLEDLGLPGDKGEALAHWAAREGLADAEMSDLQRAEARRLMLRRGIDPLPEDTGLTERLHAFIDRSETFAMPNRKAAYELTHIVFYLSEYGRRDPGLSPAALRSLDHAGVLALLDGDCDLLAEICIALRYASASAPAVWEDAVRRSLGRFTIAAGPHAASQDDYHQFFVGNWAGAVSGGAAFGTPLHRGRMGFHLEDQGPRPLRRISQTLYALGDARRGDWVALRPRIFAALDEGEQAVLSEAEASTGQFDTFFAGFARTQLCGVDL